MKIKIALATLVLSFLAFTSGASLVNQGGYIVVSANTYVYLDGTSAADFINQSSGVVTLNGNMIVKGNWTNSSGSSVFQSSSGTVQLNGTNQTITGATSFPNLTKTVTAADTLTFTAGAANKTTVTGILTLQGAAGQLLSLRSSSTGTQWQLDPRGTRTLGYLDVQDSNNVNASVINVFGLNCTDSGNNTNWSFAEVASYTVTFTAGANGTISGTTPQTIFSGGTCTPVTATPDTGFYFVNWTGTGFISTSQNPLTVSTVTSNLEITANFAAIPTGHFMVNFVAGTNGTLGGSPSQLVVSGGSTRPVTAVPNNGYQFSSWTGDHSGTENPLTVSNVTANMTVTANFATNPAGFFTVTFVAGDDGSISGNVSQTVPAGSNCTEVTAVPLGGYSFLGWTGDYTGSVANITMTNVLSNMIINANFGIAANSLAIGRYLRITPSQVTGFVGSQFTKKPMVIATYPDYLPLIKAGKASLKVLNKLSAKPPLAGYADSEWGKAIKLCNTKSWDKKKTCAENLLAYPITPLDCPQVLVSVTDPEGNKLKNIVVGTAVLQPPFINKVANSYGAEITEAGAAEIVYLEGLFFSKNPPKVSLEYPVYEKDGVTIKQIKTLSLKVQKPYDYANYNQEAGKSCMEVSTGISRIAVAMPSKWPKNWQFTQGTPAVPAPHNIVIDNKVGKSTAVFHTHE